MKVAVIGSRNLSLGDLTPWLPENTTEIVSGGARGIDREARDYALSKGLHYTEFAPDYVRFGRAAPLKRNLQIIAYADLVLAFWDGVSPGTRFVIQTCHHRNIPLVVHCIQPDGQYK